ncbi:hypothetical protein NIES4071_01840 [Calothrix sp. NIES-4071]|nr:hypothetical protein NIES4071_01840 [Calothrix sp. NIES-4071]BAZ54530.1 hypothetical protein NIES4105_01830 [Calothrix sp. NIES-4105]
MSHIDPLYRFYTRPQVMVQGTRWNIKWRPDSKLCQNINNLKQQNPDLTKEDLAWHFFNTYLYDSENAEAEEHVKHFLASFSADIVRRFQQKLNRDSRSNHDTSIIEDILQITCEYASNPRSFFQGFKIRERDQYFYASVKVYITKRMYGLVRDELIRNKQVNQTITCTNLGLAAKSSRKRVKDALEVQGVTNEEVVTYIGIWNTYQEVRKTNKKDINLSTEEQFEEIARRYSQLNFVQVNGLWIKRKLEDIGRAIRDYQNPITYSLDNRYDPHDTTSVLRIENIPDTSSVEIDKLPREDIENLRNFIAKQIQELDTKAQSLLLLRHGLKLTLQKIAGEINRDTATANRRYNTLLTLFIQKIREWRKKHWNMNGEESKQDFTSEELKEIKSSLVAFLDDYYYDIISDMFQKTFYSLPVDSKNIFKSYYYSYFNKNYCKYSKSGCSYNGADLNDVFVSEACELLQAGIAQRIHDHYSLNFKLDGAAWLRLKNLEFIKQFLTY